VQGRKEGQRGSYVLIGCSFFLSSYQEIIFIDVEFALIDLVVTIFDRREWCIKCYRWSKFEKMSGAMEAVARAKWNLAALQRVVRAVRERRYRQGSLEKLRGQAAARRKSLLTRGPSLQDVELRDTDNHNS
jgi:hypothetical protein